MAQSVRIAMEWMVTLTIRIIEFCAEFVSTRNVKILWFARTEFIKCALSGLTESKHSCCRLDFLIKWYPILMRRCVCEYIKLKYSSENEKKTRDSDSISLLFTAEYLIEQKPQTNCNWFYSIFRRPVILCSEPSGSELQPRSLYRVLTWVEQQSF